MRDWTDEDLVLEIDAEGEGLTQWEIEFVESLMNQRARKRVELGTDAGQALKFGFLSEKQRSIAERICSQRCN